jgi:hypothetical protein
MTEPQLVEAFGSDIIRLDPPERLVDTPVRLAVDVILDAKPFRALLAPDKDGKLSIVLLSPKRDEDRSEYTYQALQQLLVQKYGTPFESHAGSTIESQWTLPTTVITLTVLGSSRLPIHHLSLQYRRKVADRL